MIISSFIISPTQAIAGTTATYYSDAYQGKKMANGQRFSQNSNAVASNQYKIGTRLRICHQNRCVTGVVKDKCRCSLDLSKGLFRQLASLKKGSISVRVSKI
ncbi:rare lipoprotein A [Geminocystis sp. NIES-3709]|nr:rare lipoprotein A [Geminocystis sp. NIES-3709]